MKKTKIPFSETGLFSKLICDLSNSDLDLSIDHNFNFDLSTIKSSIKKHKKTPDTYEPKEIFAFQDDLPVVDKNQILFWEWMSNYYQCSMGNILKASILSYPKSTYVI